MVPCIARHCIVPFHERLLRRRTIPCLRELMQTQWMSPNDILNLQQNKLRELLFHAATRVPYYKKRLSRRNPDGGNPRL